jgi:S-DNA-T family DNA segregation ATPase FtsK/SpoIIIE
LLSGAYRTRRPPPSSRASASPGSLELWFVDGDGGGRLAAPFARLLAADGRAAAEAVAIDEGGITRLLERLSHVVLDVQATVLQGRHSSLAELLAQAGRSPVPRRLLVISGFPTGFRRESARALQSIVRNGAASGVHTLVTVDPGVHVEDVDAESVLAGATVLTAHDGGRWRTPKLPNCTIALDSQPPAQLLSGAVDRLADAVRRAASQSIPLDPTLPPDAAFWQESAGLELATQIGYDSSGDPAVWKVSDRGNLWATFIAGTAGSGKSNLIHTLITGLAARYSPEEVEMYLLDFKEGVELWQYGPAASPSWLPHVKVLGRETDREFGLEVLNHLRAELRRRYTEFGNARLSEASYSAYREAGRRAPRLLLVLDEFQNLLLPSDSTGEQAVDVLTELARLGRAGGMHLVLATQTLNGLNEILGKLKAVLDQHEIRLALKLDPDMSDEVLKGHRDAAGLTKTGQAIYQRGAGSNVLDRVDVLHAQQESLERVRRVCAARGSRPRPPVMFDGGGRPSFDDLRLLEPALGPAVVGESSTEAVLGAPVSMAPRVSLALRPEPGNHLVLGGAGRETARALLQSATISIAAASTPGRAQFILIDPVPGRDDSVETLKAGLSALGASVVHARTGQLLRRQIERLGRLPTSAHPRTRYYLVGLEMDAFSTLGVDPDELRQLLELGPLRGVHALLWFGSLSGANDTFGFGFLEQHLLRRVLLDAARDEQLSAGFLPALPAPRTSTRVRADAWTREDPATIVRFVPPEPLSLADMRRWLADCDVARWRAPGSVA